MNKKWHHLFGLFLLDYFTDSPYTVELEKDLSLKQQFLDVVILRKEEAGDFGGVPDGLENLGEHNLITHKSLRESLNGWALQELIGHYVNYRKQVSSTSGRRLAAKRFRLYGVSTRYPRALSHRVILQALTPGVYEVVWGVDTIRIIVLSEIPEGPHNAIWRLFSAKPEVVLEARKQYQVHQRDISTIVQQLFENYRMENINMPYTVQDFQKEYVLDHLNLLSPEQRLKDLSPEQRLKNLSLEDIVNHLSPEQVRQLLERFRK